jgi:Cytochrome oxidase complex assembly protein 1
MSADVYGTPQQPPQRGWFARNWLWVIPVGCFLPLLLCCGGGAVFFMMGINVLKATDVYVDAVAKAKANPKVKELLGEPITEGFMPMGNVAVDNNKGNADFTVQLTGPKGSGTLHVVSAKTAEGHWAFTLLDVDIPGNDKINLLKKD